MNVFMNLVFITLLISCGSTQKNESVGEYLDSSAITAKVKAAMAIEKKIEALDINVVTYKSTVQLSGFVDNKEQRLKAEEMIKNVKGVDRIINSIYIKTKI